LVQILDFACNLVQILDCDFIVELLADPNLDCKIIVGSAEFASNLGGLADLYTPIHTPPPFNPLSESNLPLTGLEITFPIMVIGNHEFLSIK
jgi:hypothetical protein